MSSHSTSRSLPSQEKVHRSFVLAVGALSVTSTWLFAGSPASSKSGTVSKSSEWRAEQTESFHIHAAANRDDLADIGKRLEACRAELCSKWLGQKDIPVWHSKCVVVLHPTRRSYERHVGAGGTISLGSTSLEFDTSGVTLRRIDVLADRTGWFAAAVPHEMTHVVLADRFHRQPLPRWADEGMALLADTADKQSLHQRDLHRAVADRAAFRVVEILELQDYPPAGRWGTFYGQSASLVKFLVQRGTPAQFVEFVERALEAGYDPALREVYGLNGITALELAWHQRPGAPRRATAFAE